MVVLGENYLIGLYETLPGSHEYLNVGIAADVINFN